MSQSIEYRDYLIYPSLVSYRKDHDWTYQHKDFDLDDRRCGCADSVNSCKLAIDEALEESCTPTEQFPST